MNTKKRLFAILLSAAMMFTLMPVMAFADDDPTAVEPVSVVWDAPYDLTGVIGKTEILNLEIPGMSGFDVTYSDGSVKEFVCTDFGDNIYFFFDKDKDLNENYYDLDACVYPYLDENTPAFVKGSNQATMNVMVWYNDADGEQTHKVLQTDVTVMGRIDQYPKAVEFVPASGFTATCDIGLDYIDERNFYGEGNKFVVTYDGCFVNDDGDMEEGEFTRSYYYTKVKTSDGDTAEGFFYKGDVDEQRFEFVEGKDVNLGKGTHEIEFTYEEYVEELDEVVSVSFKVTITASRLDAHTNYPIYSYTGKVIQPKFKVYDTENNIIPATEYTVSKAKAKKLGWYTVTIKFKDTSKYPASIKGHYGIGPKKPVLTKVTAGKKKLLVRWKKYKKSELKNIDMMIIQVSTDKHFLNGVKTVKVSKKQIKKGKKLVTGLKKGKKYYVRAYVYKNITQNGVKSKMKSAESKVLIKKTK